MDLGSGGDDDQAKKKKVIRCGGGNGGGNLERFASIEVVISISERRTYCGHRTSSPTIYGC